MTKEKFESITKWQDEAFPKSTARSRLIHLQQEVKETKKTLRIKGSVMAHEFADCFLLLYGAVHKAGMTLNEINTAIDEKMSINRKRKWGKPSNNGVYKHIQ